MKCDRCKEDRKDVLPLLMLIKNEIKPVYWCNSCSLVEDI